MAIIASKPKSQFNPAPEGLHSAICCDVVDLGMLPSPWGDRHQIEIRWQLDLIDQKSKGKWPFMVTRKFGLSLGPKSHLRPILESWRGRKFTKEELESFDLEKLIGVNCQVQVIHNIVDGGETYANVQAVVPPAKNAPKMRISESYVRVVEREKRAKLEADPFGTDPFGDVNPPDDTEVIPF